MILSITGFLIGLLTLQISFASEPYKYCVPIQKFDLNPFRKISDGKELAYLHLLTIPYIKKNEDENSILKSYAFSPDGKTMQAKLNDSIVFNDGSKITPREAALGIAFGFAFRPIGERVKVKGIDIKKRNSNLHSVPGIKVINDSTFEIQFETKISNPTGVIREALSDGSTQNRVWPIKLDEKSNNNSLPTIASKYKYSINNSIIHLEIFGSTVILANEDKCAGSEFSFYPEAIKSSTKNFFHQKQNTPRAIIIMTNSASNNFKNRKLISNWIRSAFENQPHESGLVKVNSFFVKGEPGFQESRSWDEDLSLKELKSRTWEISVEIPIFAQVILDRASRDNVKLKIIDYKPNSTPDAVVLSSVITEGRYIVLQDILHWNNSLLLLKNSPMTIQILKKIENLSASTLPPDDSTLQEFEKTAQDEYSLIPVGRRYAMCFSKKGLPIQLECATKSEMRFIKSDNFPSSK